MEYSSFLIFCMFAGIGSLIVLVAVGFLFIRLLGACGNGLATILKARTGSGLVKTIQAGKHVRRKLKPILDHQIIVPGVSGYVANYLSKKKAFLAIRAIDDRLRVFLVENDCLVNPHFSPWPGVYYLGPDRDGPDKIFLNRKEGNGQSPRDRRR